MAKELQIRNSTAEFLIFQAEDKAKGVQVFYQDENIWATQEAIATLFDKGRSTIFICRAIPFQDIKLYYARRTDT